MLEVPQLMRQDRLHLIGTQLLEQGVKEHHPFAVAKTGEKSIGVRRSLGAIHHKKPFGFKARALHERGDALLEGVVIQGGELVKEGHRKSGRYPNHEELKGDHGTPGLEPPIRTSCIHEPQNKRNQGYSEHQSECDAFDHVGDPQFQREFIKAKALFDHKGLNPRQGQIDQTRDEHKGQDEDGFFNESQAQPRHQGLVEPVDPTQERPAHDHQGL